MSYKSEFASNNVDLQNVLNMVNSLPDKVKKCKITIKSNNAYGATANLSSVYIEDTQYYADYEGTLAVVEVDPGTEIMFGVGGESSTAEFACYIMVDNETVRNGGSTYEYTVTGDLEVQLNIVQYDSTPTYYGVVVATTLNTDTEIESIFTPTDSGGTTYKSKFADNNVDLRKMLEAINTLGAGDSSGNEDICTITITGTGNETVASGSYIIINNVKYYNAQTIEVPVGTEVTVYGRQNGSNGGVFLNGTFVSISSYTYTVNSDISVKLYSYGGTMATGWSKTEINEIFTFYLTGKTSATLHAEEGMTWVDWVNSSYNTIGITMSDNIPIINSSGIWDTSYTTAQKIKGTDIIKSDFTYTVAITNPNIP